MRLLLDTHILLWLMDDSPRLGPEGRSLIVNATEVFVSSACGRLQSSPIGEASGRCGRYRFQARSSGAQRVDVTYRHALATSKLPRLHGDPFDRLLVVQAIVEPMRLVTSDPRLTAYSELVTAV